MITLCLPPVPSHWGFATRHAKRGRASSTHKEQNQYMKQRSWTPAEEKALLTIVAKNTTNGRTDWVAIQKNHADDWKLVSNNGKRAIMAIRAKHRTLEDKVGGAIKKRVARRLETVSAKLDNNIPRPYEPMPAYQLPPPMPCSSVISKLESIGFTRDEILTAALKALL